MEQELVDKISNSGIKKSKIEKDLGMPENSLSGMVNGSRPTPKRWATEIPEYLDKNKRVFGWMKKDGTSGETDEVPDSFKVKDIEMDSIEQQLWRLINNYCTEQKITIAYLISFHDAHREIAAIEKEEIPANRNTPMGKVTWEIDKKKRIEELKKRL